MTNKPSETDEESYPVLRRTVIKTAAVGAAATAVSGKALGGTAEAVQQESEATVVFPDQTITDTTISIESATLPDGGFISLQDPSLAGVHWEEQHDRDFFDLTVLGTTEYLEPGTSEDVEINLDDPLDPSDGRPFYVMLHPDTNDNDEFDYVESAGGEDFGYFFLANNPVLGDAMLEIEEVTPTETPQPTPTATPEPTSTASPDSTPTDEPTATDSPGFGAIAGLAGIGVSAAAIARRVIGREEDEDQ